MSKKWPRCESKDIHITEYPNPTGSMATCYGCGYADLLEKFPEQTLFDLVTQSPETLAENSVYVHVVGDRDEEKEYFFATPWTSEMYETIEAAVAAAVEKLKEVRNA